MGGKTPGAKAAHRLEGKGRGWGGRITYKVALEAY